MQEFFSTAMLIALLGGVFVVSNPVASFFTGSTTYTGAAQAYLDSSIGDMRSFFMSLTQANYLVMKGVGFSYTGSLSGYYFAAFMSRAPKSGAVPLTIALTGAMDNLSNAMMLQVAQKMFLLFFLEVIPRWFLPIGILLRLVPFTRKIGAAVIAISIGCFIVYPWALVLSGEVYDVLRTGFHGTDPDHPGVVDPNKAFGVQDIGAPPGRSVLCQKAMPLLTIIGELLWSIIDCGWSGPAYPVCSAGIHIWYYITVGGFQAIFTPFLMEYGSKFDVTDAANKLYTNALPGVSERIITTVALTLFSAIMTITITKSINLALGGEGQLYGLSKLI